MNLEHAWPALRPVLREFSFADIKDIVGAATLPIHRLHHLHQGSSYTSKGQLMSAIDGLYSGLIPDHQRRVVTHCISEMLDRDDSWRGKLEELLSRFGWGLAGTEPHPLHLQVNVEVVRLPDAIQKGLEKGLRRYRDGDFDGAITAICGVVDQLTETLYRDHELGDHRTASYHERISKSYGALQPQFLASLTSGGVPPDRAQLVWHNQSKSVGQAGFVLGSFRQWFADVHGVNDAPRVFVQRALDSAVYIIRCLGGFT